MNRLSRKIISLALVICMIFIISAPITYATSNVIQYPDEKVQSVPRSNPTLLDNFDVFSPPTDSVIPATGAPIIFDYTRTAGPDDSISINGANITADTHFMVYTGTSAANGVLLEAKVMNLDAPKYAVVTLPLISEGMQPWSVYMIWAVNSFGKSYPIIINKADVYWAGPDEAKQGEKVSVFGRNMSNGNKASNGISYVYLISKTTGQGQWVNVDNADQTKAVFTVPNVANGTYEIWVHNGHGGKYGWSKSPNDLKVVTPVTWSDTTFNVKTSYGAIGDGVSDDTAAIKNAISAAALSPMSTVFFPAGTYKITSDIKLVSNVRYLGQGKTATIIKSSGDVGEMMNYDNCSYIEVRDLCLDSTEGNIDIVDADGKTILPWDRKLNMANLTGIGTNHIWMESLEFKCNYYSYALGQPFKGTTGKNVKRGISGEYVYLNNCKMQSNGFVVIASRQVFITNNEFIGDGASGMMVYSWNNQQFSVENNSLRDYDPTIYPYVKGRVPPFNETRYCARFFVHCSQWGADDNIYVGYNDVRGIDSHPTLGDTNSGELVLFEAALGKKVGAPTSVISNANSSTMTFDVSIIYSDKQINPNNYQRGLTDGSVVYITNGKGEGQHRKVVSYDEDTKEITVEPAWTVEPDSTSVCTVNTAVSNAIIYGNHLEGETDVLSRVTSSCGVSIYESMNDTVISNNTIKNVTSGICNWPAYSRATDPNSLSASQIGPTANNMIVENNVTNARRGIRYIATDTGGTSFPAVTDVASIGSVFRSNTFTNLTDEGVYYSSTTTVKNDIFEKNIFTNVLQGFYVNVNTQSYFPIGTATFNLYKNVFTRGTAALTKSVGINFDYFSNSSTVKLRENAINGFETLFKKATGYTTSFEIPYRNIKAKAMTSSSVNSSVKLWNSGTASINWTATKNVNWISLTKFSGTIADQNSSDDLTYTCNTAGLQPGTYTGKISVTSGTVTKDVEVNLIVLSVTGTSLTPPTKTNYIEGQDLDLSGGKLSVIYDDASSTDLNLTSDGITITGYNKNLLGNQTVMVTYAGISKTFGVNVVAKTATGITLTAPSKIRYLLGDDINLLGGKITVTYDNGLSEDKLLTDSGVTVTGYNKNNLGTQTITVTYLTFSKTFEVTVSEVILGDVNGDTKINTVDALMVLQYSSGKIVLTDKQLQAANVSGDNKVNTVDALMILQYASGKITGFK